MYKNKVFYKNSQSMSEVPNNVIDLIITSPPYFNIKDYAKDGKQVEKHSRKIRGQLGDVANYKKFIGELYLVWKECERVLKPNGKLIINTPLMPMKKAELNSHYNRHIFDLNSDIQNSIINAPKSNLFLYDTYIWNRTNTAKSLMFGSYPYPRNFYAQNTSEFITVYVKDGKPTEKVSKEIKEKSKITQNEWTEYTKHIWNIPIPNKSDLAYGTHTAIMPEEIVYRCVKLFSFVDDLVLDPFTGSGTTLKVAKELGRNYVGYEIMPEYKTIIKQKLSQPKQLKLKLDGSK